MRTILAVALLSMAGAVFAEPAVRHTFESSVPAGTVRRIIIDIPAGDISVRNGAENALSLSGWASREPDSPGSRDKEQRIVDQSSVEIYVKGNEAIVRRRLGGEADGFRGKMFTSYDVKLTVPAGIAIDFDTSVGNIEMDGVFGDIDIDLRAGDIHVRTPRASVRELSASCRVGQVRANIGDQTTINEGVFPGRIQFRNPSGKSIVSVHATTGDVKIELTQ